MTYKDALLEMKDPFGLPPSAEIVRMTAEAMPTEKCAQYQTLVGLILAACKHHGYADVCAFDLSKYTYFHTMTTYVRGGLQKSRCRIRSHAPGKMLGVDISLQCLRDIIYVERQIPKADIYPGHLPTGAKWSKLWKARRNMVKHLMHIHYYEGRANRVRRMKLTERAKKIQRTVHTKRAVEMFPDCVPEEAYLRYAEYFYEERMTKAQKAAVHKELVRG